MKKKLIAGLITLCAVFITACSNKPSNDSADSTTPPVTESTGQVPEAQAGPADTTDDTQAAQTSPTDTTDTSQTAQTSPTDTTNNAQAVQTSPAPKTAADNTTAQKAATDEQSATGKNSTTDTTSANTSARAAASSNSSKGNKLLIGKKKAKSIALKDAGLKKKKVHFTEVKLDYDDGRSVYDIEFYSGKKEYDYEIDASTGKILSRDWDRRDNKTTSANNTANGNTNNNTANGSTNNNTASSKISMAEAKKIALKSIGLTENDGRWKKAKSDKDDGRFLYELEFVSGKTEHEFEIDANSGEILEYDKEPIR